MAALTWVDIDEADIAAEKPLTETLVANFWNNQECLITQHCGIRFAEENTNQSVYTAVHTEQVYVPPCVVTSAADVDLVFQPEVWITGGGTSADWRARLNGGSWVTGSSTDVASGPDAMQTLRLPSADVKAAAGTVVLLEIEMKTTGGGVARIQHRDPVSYYERAA